MRRNINITIAAGLALCSAAIAEVHTVNQVGITFVPSEITVAPGDTVEWVWASMNHTVTSGSLCAPDGLWFNELFNVANPLVTWNVPAKAVGDVPYFCMPHCGFGMTGIIHVVDACLEDLDGSGAVDVGDILSVIGAWGQAGVPQDIDGSGTVDVGDMLMLIGVWGPC